MKKTIYINEDTLVKIIENTPKHRNGFISFLYFTNLSSDTYL